MEPRTEINWVNELTIEFGSVFTLKFEGKGVSILAPTGIAAKNIVVHMVGL